MHNFFDKKRIAKVISDFGLSSRRGAEKLILEGNVKVNGAIITSPALNISSNDAIEVNGQLIDFSSTKQIKLWLYYKTAGLVTTHSDPENRKTVFDDVSNLIKEKVISVGRLDLNSEGLLLLTNSGELARKFELPSNEYERIYHVKAFGNNSIIKDLIHKANSGIAINGVFYQPFTIKLLKDGNNKWFEIILKEGKNREIRNIFAHFNFSIARLIRIQYGPWKLGNLKKGKVLEINLDKCNFVPG